MKKPVLLLAFVVLILLIVATVTKMGGSVPHGNHALPIAWLATIIIFAQVVASIVNRIGQPSVLGELLSGVILANLGLLGINFFEDATKSEILHFMAELGVILLLFKVGLHATVEEMRLNAKASLLVAIAGVIAPIFGGFLMSQWFFEGSIVMSMFFGGTLCATSLGITMKIFQDLKIQNSKEAKISLGAGIFDDVIGLIVLTMLLSMVVKGSVDGFDILLIIFKAIGFFFVVVVVGDYATPAMNRFFANLNRELPMQFAVVIFLCFGLAYVADLLGLASIIGAFATGLFLKRVHFSEFHIPELLYKIKKIIPSLPEEKQEEVARFVDRENDHTLDQMTDQLGHFFMPVFFVMTGMSIDLAVFNDLYTVLIVLGVTVVAVITKILAGFFAGKRVNSWIVGIAMVPRGEVGLIFAAIGKAQGVFDSSVYSILVAVVILTTFVTPPLLALIVKKRM